ncbi:MAG: universal stress protein [Verrucomicrobiales bacterium]|nr:universal stress protein [Verrucomicrobiales bacterium]
MNTDNRPSLMRFCHSIMAAEQAKESWQDLAVNDPKAQVSGSNLLRANPVLVSLDLRTSTSTAMELALGIASRRGTALVLLHVIDWACIGGFLFSRVRGRQPSAVEPRARQHLEAIMDSYAEHGVPMRCLIREGVPEHEILKLAGALNAELIVLGRSARGALSRLLFGSVTCNVVETSRCPVLVVPAHWHPSNQPLAPVPEGNLGRRESAHPEPARGVGPPGAAESAPRDAAVALVEPDVGPVERSPGATGIARLAPWDAWNLPWSLRIAFRPGRRTSLTCRPVSRRLSTKQTDPSLPGGSTG